MPRSVTITDVRSVARGYTHLALKVLSQIAGSPRCQPAARVAAAGLLLDRGWGKPSQSHDLAGAEVRIIIRRILDEDEGDHSINSGDPKVIEHAPDTTGE